MADEEKKKPYWEDRQEKKYLAGEKKVNDYYKELEKAFEQSKNEIQTIINNFYIRYANENGLSYTAAQIALSKEEIGDLKYFINLAYANMDKYNQVLNNMSIKARITRYQALEKQIDAVLQQLYSIEYQYKGEELLNELYNDSYYKTWHNIDVYKGFHQEFAQVSSQAVDELIKYPFNGANFSDRIWKQKDHMLQKLNESITTMLVQGKNPRTLNSDFAKTFATKKHESYRLLHTEGSFIMGQGTLAAYKEDGVEKYQLLATLDIKTSETCRDKDGQIHDVDKAVVGVNYWPFHPHCRTTDVPYYEDTDYSKDTRVARDPVTGKTYEVPADMTYNEWYDKYVKDNPEAVLTETKWKNRHADQKQYERFKDVLGDELSIEVVDEFQNVKYNNGKDWDELKDKYDNTRLGKYLQNQFSYIYNGEELFIPNKTVFETTKIIAGGKSKVELRVKDKLSEKYGGNPDDWLKKVGKVESDKYIFDLHWFELDGKQYEMKLKNRGDKK